MLIKVAVYGRVSTEHEAQISALSNQIEYYDEIISKHSDWILYKRYIDEGITGTSMKKRKNFLKMVEDAKNGCFDLIVTREVSRFARNTVDTLQVTRELKNLGVEVYFVEDNIWTMKDDDGELKLTIMATLAQNESKKISQRVKAGQKISFINGVIYGTGNILGYDKVGKEMVVNKEQAKTVKFIFESFLKGDGTTKIKYELEKSGIPTATGLKKWSSSTITRVLQNPFYCGDIVYRKSYVSDYLEHKIQKNNGEIEKIIVEGKHEKLVSKEDFQKVQKIISEHSKHITSSTKCGHGVSENVWSKKLICKCGSKFNRRIYHRDNGIITYCYQCYNQKNNGSFKQRLNKGLDITGACDVALVPEWKLSLIINRIFTMLCNDKEKILNIVNNLLDNNINNDEIMDDDELNEINVKIINNKKKLDKILDLYLNEMITKDSYINKKEEIELNIKNLENKRRELDIEENGNNYLKDKIEELKNILAYKLNGNNSCIADSLIDGLIDKIIVDNNKFIVKMNSSVRKDIKKIVLFNLIINKDDVENYVKKHNNYKKLRLKEPIMVEVII